MLAIKKLQKAYINLINIFSNKYEKLYTLKCIASLLFFLQLQYKNIMRSQTFQQQRIVELSRQIDQLRDRNQKLTLQAGKDNEQIQQFLQNEKKMKETISLLQADQRNLEKQLQNLKREFKDLQKQLKQVQDKKQEVEVENVRQRQSIDELKEEMIKYQNKMKEILYEKQKQLAAQEKQNFKLRQQNIETEKLYMSRRQQFNKKQQKHLKALSQLMKELENLRKDIEFSKKIQLNDLEKAKAQNNQAFRKIYEQIARIEAKIADAKQLKKQIEELKDRLQQVVAENSQNIIELYKCKHR